MKRVVLLVVASAACSTSPPHYTGFSDGGGSGFPFGFDGGATSAAQSADGSSPPGVDAAPPTPAAHVRFGDWVPDAPAAGYALCLTPHGTQSWMGPFQPDGLAFPGTGAYATVPPGTYDAQLVAASSGGCSGGIAPMPTDLPALDDGTYVTVAALGDVTPTFTDPSMAVAAFLDDPVGPAGKASLRVIDAAPSLKYVSIGTGSRKTGDFRPLFVTATFGTPATTLAGGQMVDANGYAQLMPLSGVELSVQPLSAAGDDVATASNVTLGPGSVATLVVVGGNTGGAPVRIVICDDASAARGSASACKSFSR